MCTSGTVDVVAAEVICQEDGYWQMEAQKATINSLEHLNGI